MRQHFIKHGIVDDYSQGQNQKGITGFHMERWLKRALASFNVATYDNCCDTATLSPASVQPIRYNPNSGGSFERFNGTTWISASTGASGYTTNRALISNSSGDIAVSAVTSTELFALSGLNTAFSLQSQLNVRPVVVAAPGSAGATGVAGTIAYDATHFYVCIATNTWVRTDLVTW